MPRNDESGGVGGALRRHWRAALAELLATALLVLLGCASCLPELRPDHTLKLPALSQPALGFGFVILCNVEVFGPVSGAHMNPAVTLAAVLVGQLAPTLGGAYCAAQLLGAVLGFAALQALAPAGLAPLLPAMGATLPGAGVSPLAATVVEALLTGMLVLLCCAVWTAPAPPDRSVPIKFGLTVAGLVFAGGPLTGASLNPARSLAPALLQGVWDHHWVYWVGPLGGAALCALAHRLVLAPRAHAAARASAAASASAPAPAALEDLPLHDKNNC